jgi:hypothetical protein
MSRFYVGNCMGTLMIVDSQNKDRSEFIGNSLASAPHRVDYTHGDARAVVDMLNEREFRMAKS